MPAERVSAQIGCRIAVAAKNWGSQDAVSWLTYADVNSDKFLARPLFHRLVAGEITSEYVDVRMGELRPSLRRKALSSTGTSRKKSVSTDNPTSSTPSVAAELART